MSDAKVKGIVHLVEDTKTYGQNGFRKRLVVLEQDTGRFTKHIPIEFTQERCDTADSLSLGDEVEITYRLNGRKWQRDPSSEVKFFLSAEAVSFQVVAGEGNQAAAANANDAFAEAAYEDDDVPF